VCGAHTPPIVADDFHRKVIKAQSGNEPAVSLNTDFKSYFKIGFWDGLSPNDGGGLFFYTFAPPVFLVNT
jgi:hypothetical protein